VLRGLCKGVGGGGVGSGGGVVERDVLRSWDWVM
jgi:hypothetical protein